MAQDLRIYLETDAGVGVSGWTVTLRQARKTGPPGTILNTTSTDVNGMAEFLAVDSTTAPWDIYATNGTAVREWRGYTSPPISTTNLKLTTNALTNGDFSVWQRGTSFAAPASSAFNADRWQWVISGAAVVTIARSTDVPTVGANAINTPYSLYVDVTTADAAIAAGDNAYLRTVIEGFDYRALTNGFTCSFWVKGAKTGIHAVSFLSPGFDRAYVAEYTISAANTWEYKTVVVSTPPTAGTWSYTTGAGLYVHFPLMAGTTYHTTKDAWQTGFYLSTAAAVNEVDNAANDFRIALVNVIPGSVAAPLAPLPYAVQLERCQRYYEILADTNHVIAANGQCTGTTAASLIRPLTVEKGGTPTVTITAATSFNVRAAGGTTVACTTLTCPNAYTNMLELTAAVASGLVAGNATRLDSTGGASLVAEWNPT